MNPDQVAAGYPRLYHMAHADAWPGIQQHGLLSTTALLDLFEVEEPLRTELETRRRPDLVAIEHPVHGRAVIRDNKPLSDAKLERCLTDMAKADYYRLLNSKVFFWPTEQRLETLLRARAYRHTSHTVITVDTRRLLDRYAAAVTLSAINSGSTAYDPRPRGSQTFQRIEDYPYDDWRRKRGASTAIAEIAVDYAVFDVEDVAVMAQIRSATGARTTLWTA